MSTRIATALGVLAVGVTFALGALETNAETLPQPLHVGQDCEMKLRNFVAQLDNILASDSHTVDPIRALLKRAFPVEGCDIDKAIELCQRSKFFSNVSEEPKYYNIVFNS